MKIYSFLIVIIFSLSVNAQSPELAVDVKMNGKDTIGKRLLIEMKICVLKQPSDNGSWFSKDTSTINFNKLTAADFECGKYMYNGEGKEILSGDIKYARYNHYAYRNQLFAWEKVIVIRITNTNPGNTQKSMFIILPVKYKAFVTAIVFDNVPFTPNSIYYFEDAATRYKKTKLYITADLNNYTPVPVENSPFKKWLF